MHQAVRDDRLWFQRHPTAIVRFRKAAPEEFRPLEQHGEEAPVFRPSFSKASAALGWVAVVDLMQLLGSTTGGDDSTPCARLRLRTPAMRSKAHRQAAKQELMKAVAAELLAQTDPVQWDAATTASDEPEHNNMGTDAPMAA